MPDLLHLHRKLKPFSECEQVSYVYWRWTSFLADLLKKDLQEVQA